MKMRRKMSHTELVEEVFRELESLFTPEVKMIKKMIEFLIEKEYLQRVKDEKNVYEYIP
ncbi:unnamed protein product [Onchocerca flexuosa]|nr:unnamed protein product [Onchocerca flexuosa]